MSVTSIAGLSAAEKYVPIAQGPLIQAGQQVDDGNNTDRLVLVHQRWSNEDMALIYRDRSVEENIRVLLGDMWSVWSPVMGKFINIAFALGAPETVWRELPRVNLCADWFDLTVARLTENAPILGATAQDADRLSAMLAEACDVLLPKLWDELGMSERVLMIAAWMASAGWCFLKTVVDFEAGEDQPVTGPAILPHPETGEPMTAEHVPYDAQGNPLVSLVPQADGSYGYQATGEPATQKEGCLRTDVLSPLECRGEWGPAFWQEKRWHIHRSYLSPKTITDRWGIEIPADTSVDDSASGMSYLMRLQRGTGHYGAADGSAQGISSFTKGPQTALCTVDEMWERPCPEYPEGRLLIVTKEHVLFDGPRPFPKLTELRYTSPIVYCPFMQYAGRPFGSTTLERGVPLNRAYNQIWRQKLQHVAKVTNPIMLVDRSTGLTEEDADSAAKPGSVLFVDMAPGITDPIRYVAPATLSADVDRTMEKLESVFWRIMNMEGAEGAAATATASGELQKELRFNSDRPISVPVRNLARALEETGNLWLAMLPVIWPDEKTISYVGEDAIARTLMIMPDMWDGRCKLQISAESMMPRSRQERKAQAFQDWQAGAYGMPMDPQARAMYFEQAGYPDMQRADGPAGPDKVTCEHLIGQILQGTNPQTIPMLPQWNMGVMKATLRDFVAQPDYLRFPPETQRALQYFWLMIEKAEQFQALMQQQQMMQVQGAATAMTAPLAMAHAGLQGKLATLAQPEPNEPPAGSSQQAA